MASTDLSNAMFRRPVFKSSSKVDTAGGLIPLSTSLACSALVAGISMSGFLFLSSAAPAATLRYVSDGLVAMAVSWMIESLTAKLRSIAMTAAFSVTGAALEKSNILVVGLLRRF